MGTITKFKLPDVGEGLTEAEVVQWRVAEGDVVEVNQIVCAIETAKSVVELPSPVAGTISQLHAEAGSTVNVGAVLITFQVGKQAKPAQPVDSPHTREPEAPLVLVGTGPREAQQRRRRLSPLLKDSVPISPMDKRERSLTAAPPVDTDPKHARETRTPVAGVRRVTADAMVRSAFTAPHVTEWLTVDATPTMDLIGRLRADRAWTDVRVTPLLFVAKALLLAIGQYPGINAWWDEAAGEIVQPAHVNLGIAVATSRGLLVPNIKEAQDLDLRSLASALDTLVTTARQGRAQPREMALGTITITNLGSLGVDAGTPILNPGEAGILALGSIQPRPWVLNGKVVVRQVAQLAISFDHRLVDGELGSQVLAFVGRVLSDPAEAILYAR